MLVDLSRFEIEILSIEIPSIEISSIEISSIEIPSIEILSSVSWGIMALYGVAVDAVFCRFYLG